MTVLFHIAATLLLSGLPCTVGLQDGTITSGELRSINKQHVIVSGDSNETERTLSLDQVQRITSDTMPMKRRPDNALLIQLVDGSQLVAKDMTLESGIVSITPWSGTQTLDHARKQFQSVRFGMPSADLDSQWNEIVAAEHAGDTLVIRKSPSSLDYLEGVVVAMNEEMVTFQYDGSEIPVKRTKLEGIRFYQRSDPDAAADPTLIVSLRSGSQLKSDSLVAVNDQLTATTLGGVTWSVPLSQLTSVDFAVGRNLFLSDTEPAELTVTPHIASSLDAQLTQLIYQPRRDAGQNRRPLQLRFPSLRNSLTTYPKGLCLHSRTRVSYRLGNAYRQLNAIAGIAPELRERGAVKLSILGDEETLLEEVIRGGEEPVEINLDVSKRRRVTIIVDYADDLDIADRLHLCNLRVTK